MALQTQGFALSALPRTPNIPDNVGKMDVPGLYDAVVKGLQTQEALRTTLARQQAADAQLALIPVQAAADTATANRTTALASPALVGQEVANRGAKLDSDLIAEQNRRDQEKMLQGMTPEQRYILEKNGPAKFALSSTTPTGNGMLRSTSQEGVTLNGKQYPLSQSVSEGPYALNKALPAGLRELEALLAGMSPADREKAIRVHLGMDPRAAINKAIPVKGADGSIQMMTYDPQTNIFAPASTVGGETVARSQNTAEKETATKQADLAVQKQANFPKAQQSIRDWDTNSKDVIGTLDDLSKALDEFGATSTGIKRKFAARVPGTDEYNIQQAINTALANVSFDKLSALRAASKTGGALGNVSDKDLQLLQSSIASLDLGLDIGTLKKNIQKVKERYENMNKSQHMAFEQEYADELKLPNPLKQADGTTTDKFELGKVYEDANGAKAKYLGNGQWEDQ